MLAVQNSNKKLPTSFVKMSGAGNDFVIFDARATEIELLPDQIKKICDRRVVGCDQLIVIKNGSVDGSHNCEMIIYNSDGSRSGACGNATRCVASILMEEKNLSQVRIKTAANILKCWKSDDLISVEMGIPTFDWQKIPMSRSTDTLGFKLNEEKISDYEWSSVNVGNPHCVTFLQGDISDEEFFRIGPQVEVNPLFTEKTNVEFARILSDDLIEVRVWERGVGETLACGTGACAVAVIAIKKNLTRSREITTRFKGGDLMIRWNEQEKGSGSNVVMTGDYKKIFVGKIVTDLFE